MSGRPVRAGVAVGLGLLLPVVAGAHDFATRTAAHRLQILVDVDRIVVDYTVEAPFAAALAPSMSGRTLDVQTPDEVTSGLLLTVDGLAVPLRPDPDQRPRVRASSHTEAIRVWLVADAPVGPEATIEVSNANYPDLAGQFWTEVWLGAQVDVLDSALIPEGPDGPDLTQRWREDEAARRAEVHVRLRRGPLAEGWARLGGLDDARPLAMAAPATLRTFWTRGTLRPGEFLVLAAAATALAVLVHALADPGRGWLRIAAAGAAASVLLLFVATPGLGPPVELGGGLVALGLAAYGARRGEALPAALGGVLATALMMQRPGYAALLATIVATTLAAAWRLAPSQDRERASKLAVGLGAVVGLAAVARGVAVLWGPG